MAEWIDGTHGDYSVGQMGFRIDRSNPIRHTESTTLALHPARTNQSHAIQLWGWCGSWNDTNTYGNGIAQVTRVARNGRVQLVEVTDPKAVQAFLEKVGYADLFEHWEKGRP